MENLTQNHYAELKKELDQIVSEAGHENIWRPLRDLDNILLAKGIYDMREGSPQDLAKVNFKDKTVVDLGCNFGFYSFLCRKLGAKKVIGVDIDPLAIKGSYILKQMYGLDRIEFLEADFLADDLPGPFDISLLVGFLGKQMIQRGINHILDSVERLTSEAMIFTARTHYRINKHLGGDREGLLRHYPEKYVPEKYFLLLDYLCDYFGEKWNARVLSSELFEDIQVNLVFVRK